MKWPFSFSYNAVEDKGRRQAPRTKVRHESVELNKYKREKLQATAIDQARNHSLVAWMVRKHLDYVSSFHFSFRTANPEADPINDPKAKLDTLVNRIFKWHGAPNNIDFLGRFGRDEMFRLFELEKILCGDAGLVKLPDIKLQALESDLIYKGSIDQRSKVTQEQYQAINNDGIIVDDFGRITDFSVCFRDIAMSGRVIHHVEPRENVIFDGYWSRFSSQWRGVSPLASAINTVADVYEGLEYNIVKAKMMALFAIAIIRKSETGEMGAGSGVSTEQPNADGQSTPPTTEEKTLNPTMINILDMEAGEDVKAIESNTPSTQFIDAMYLYIQIAMLALDIPVTCFDSRRSSFSARIADLNEYEVACVAKRTKNRYVRQEYSNWVLETIWNDQKTPWPLRQLAADAGMSLRDIQEYVEWIAAGSPWLDKYKQVQGDQLAIGMGIDNPVDAARRRGSDVFKNIDKTAQVLAYAKSKNVPVLIGEQPIGYAETAEQV